MNKQLKQRYSIFINDNKIGAQTIALEDIGDGIKNFKYRLSAANQDVSISSKLKNNTIIQYNKSEYSMNTKTTESFNLLKDTNYKYIINPREIKLSSKFELNFLERVLFYPNKNIEKDLANSKIIDLKTLQIYKLKFVKVEENKFKIYSPETAYLEYDENGVLLTYFNLDTGVKIVR